jgi:hypothetical protein
MHWEKQLIYFSKELHISHASHNQWFGVWWPQGNFYVDTRRYIGEAKQWFGSCFGGVDEALLLL